MFAPTIRTGLSIVLRNNDTAPRHLGCFADNDTKRDLPELMDGLHSTTMSQAQCLSRCAGYKYFGLQDGHQCFCGDSYGTYGGSSACNTSCVGNWRDANCGGQLANDVFEVPPDAFNVTSAPGAQSPSYLRGYDDHSLEEQALKVAAQADVTILALGENLKTNGEWSDRDCLDPAGTQLTLLQRVLRETSTRVVVVLVTGRALTFGAYNASGHSLLDEVESVIVVGRPGVQGSIALGQILLGEVNPSGKLAASWPRSVGHIGSGSSPWLQMRRGKWIANHRWVVDVWMGEWGGGCGKGEVRKSRG
jgi:hypothetical protein